MASVISGIALVGRCQGQPVPKATCYMLLRGKVSMIFSPSHFNV